jgi:hypothetical protein
MSDPFEVGRRSRAPGDQYMDSIAATTALEQVKAHPLDGDEARKLHRQLMEWYYHERPSVKLCREAILQIGTSQVVRTLTQEKYYS